MSEWQPIETAPKDKPILVWNNEPGNEEWCPYCENWNGVVPERGRLCLYHAHAEGLSAGPHGLQIAEWGGGWEDGYEDGGGWMPDWWFQCGSECEVALNPTHWMPLPNPPE